MPATSALTRFGRLFAIAALLTLGACSNMDAQQQKMVSGGAAGAVVGTVATAVTGGCIPCGTAIGGALGTAGGYLMNKLDKNTKEAPSSSDDDSN